jgi:hypothetical protein
VEYTGDFCRASLLARVLDKISRLTDREFESRPGHQFNARVPKWLNGAVL